MTARTADIMGVKNIGIGSDLCLNQPDSVVEWMRNGTWTKTKNFGEGSKKNQVFLSNQTGSLMQEDLKILKKDSLK